MPEAKIVGTIGTNLVCNLRMKTPLRGLRLWLAIKLCSAAAIMLGGKLIVELEFELTTRVGEQPPTRTAIGTASIIGRSDWAEAGVSQ